MGKYIVEKKEGERLYKTIVNAFNEPVIREITYEPYAAPDLEQVRMEAYEQGYKAAKHECEDCPKQVYTDTLRMDVYQKGLSDAWEAVKKIAIMDTETSENVTGYFGLFRIMENLTPMQAIEKIRQYEQEKDRQARIEYNREEIEDVINTTMSECNVSLDDITEVLQKMRENNG